MTHQTTEQIERAELISELLEYADEDNYTRKDGSTGTTNRAVAMRKAAAMLSSDAKPVVGGELPPLPDGFSVKLERGPDELCVVSLRMNGDWVPVIRDNGELISHVVEPSGISAALLSSDAPAEWHDEKPDEWTPQIEAAHPLKTKNYKAWDTALQMVGNRRDKHALVELVCWLLQRSSDAHTGGEAVAWTAVSRSGLMRGIREGLPSDEDLAIAKADGDKIRYYYTHPQPAKTQEPLTRGQIEELFEDGLGFEPPTAIVRAIEAAHGITEKK